MLVNCIVMRQNCSTTYNDTKLYNPTLIGKLMKNDRGFNLNFRMQVDYGLLHFHSTLKLAGICVNLACFVLAALALYELSRYDIGLK